MDLVCEKYKQAQSAEAARCEHPQEYCKFRTSCMIHFLTRETAQEQRRAENDGSGGEDSGQGGTDGPSAI